MYQCLDVKKESVQVGRGRDAYTPGPELDALEGTPVEFTATFLLFFYDIPESNHSTTRRNRMSAYTLHHIHLASLALIARRAETRAKEKKTVLTSPTNSPI
jgi:hypothetical protein